MPLSDNPATVETAKGLVEKLHIAAGGPGQHKGFRPGMCLYSTTTQFDCFILTLLLAHAKGHLLTGTFTPTSSASSLSVAHHFNTPSTPITVRFSSSTGYADI